MRKRKRLFISISFAYLRCVKTNHVTDFSCEEKEKKRNKIYCGQISLSNIKKMHLFCFIFKERENSKGKKKERECN